MLKEQRRDVFDCSRNELCTYEFVTELRLDDKKTALLSHFKNACPIQLTDS